MTRPTLSSVDVAIEAMAWSEALPHAKVLATQAADAALGDEHRRGVAILLTDHTVRDLNRRYRREDAPTNVLSFPAIDNMHGELGDIALAFGVCESEARAQSKPLADHLRHLVIHGILHLLGYDHQDEAEASAMESLERELLARMGVSDPYTLSPALDVPKDVGAHG